MASTFAIRMLSGLGFEVELPHSKPLVKEVKRAIQEARGIPVYDQRLVLQGQELGNFIEVETDQEILLVIGATNAKETVLDYMRNRGAVPWGGDSYANDPSFTPSDDIMARVCALAPSHTAHRGLDVQNACPYPLGSWSWQDSIRHYLSGLREVSLGVQTSRDRANRVSDIYDRDILDLQIGEIPCQAMLDYRERSWSRFSVEDAVEVSRRRDLAISDRLDRGVLDRWDKPEGPWEAMRAYASACSAGDGQDTGRGWVALLSSDKAPLLPEAPQKVLVIDAGTCPVHFGVVDVRDKGHKHYGCAKRRQLPQPAWKAATNDWLQIFDDLQVRPQDLPVVLVEPMHLNRVCRNELCESLMATGIPAVGFIPAAVAACQLWDPRTEPRIIVDMGDAHLSATPIFEGFLVAPAIVSEPNVELEPEASLLQKASAIIEASLRRCPPDVAAAVGSRCWPIHRDIYLIGTRSCKEMAIRLNQHSGAQLWVKTDGADAAWRGAAKVCGHPQLHRLLTTREEYSEHGPSAIHRKCL